MQVLENDEVWICWHTPRLEGTVALDNLDRASEDEGHSGRIWFWSCFDLVL